MQKFLKAIDELGELHDCTIMNIEFNVLERRVTLSIKDMMANFKGLANYKGSIPGEIIFEKVSSLSIDSYYDNCNINIYSIVVIQMANPEIHINLWPSGSVRLSCKDARVLM